jgi:hypothetical protein
MKKIIKLSILVILLSLLTMSIIIPGNLKASYPPGEYPGIWMDGPYGVGCACPAVPHQCGCYMF